MRYMNVAIPQLAAQKILRAVLSQSPQDYTTEIIPGFSWKSAYESGFLFFNSANSKTKTATVMVPWWWCKRFAAHCGIPISPLLVSPPVKWWQQFEDFGTQYLGLRINSCSSLADLLHGSLVSNTVDGDWVMNTCVGVRQAVSQLPVPSQLQAVTTTAGTINITSSHYVVLKNAAGAPTDALLPRCCTNTTYAMSGTLYVQYKNWEDETSDAPSVLTNETVEKEEKKAKSAHELSDPKHVWGKFFFLLISSQPLDSQFSVQKISKDCAVVGPPQFDEFFGPFARRAHFSSSTIINLNCGTLSELRQLGNVGKAHALEIIRLRTATVFNSLKDAENRLSWHPCFDPNKVGV
eukprot:TRINITY_DN13519_c0_g1_i1.p1 TRINITY_DN13519_c0_g1~~TRINITY_DN13519_c0_g1_i1.p1  ORF type:complete len:409 (-),score=76.64 TRINITY_DN13519_c0_g1_i1:224-1273(-)